MSQKFIEKAILQADRSPMKKRYGALLVYSRRIISMGYNNYRRGISSSALYSVLRE